MANLVSIWTSVKRPHCRLRNKQNKRTNEQEAATVSGGGVSAWGYAPEDSEEVARGAREEVALVAKQLHFSPLDPFHPVGPLGPPSYSQGDLQIISNMYCSETFETLPVEVV